MKKLPRVIPSAKTLERVDRRLATNHVLRRAVVASGTALGALSYLIVINAAR